MVAKQLLFVALVGALVSSAWAWTYEGTTCDNEGAPLESCVRYTGDGGGCVERCAYCYCESGSPFMADCDGGCLMIDPTGK